MEKLVVEVETKINAPPGRVWEAITGPGSAMMPGTKVETDWQVGHPITFSGEWQGKAFRDYGEVVGIESGREVSFSHWSKTPERPADYHVVRYRLEPDGDGTRVVLGQTNVGDKPDIDDKTRAEFRKNWESMLGALKKAAEAG